MLSESPVAYSRQTKDSKKKERKISEWGTKSENDSLIQATPNTANSCSHL